MRISPTLLLITGICLAIGGFVHDRMFAGVPYPDPAPEPYAYARHPRIAVLLRLAGTGLLVAAGVWAMFRLSGSQSSGGRAGARPWLWAILVVYMTCALSSGAVVLGNDMCPGPADPVSGASAVMLLANPAIGFFTECMVLVDAILSNFYFALVVLAPLVLFVVLFLTCVRLALHDATAGRWVSWPTALMLLPLAGLSALCTLSTCGSLTA